MVSGSYVSAKVPRQGRMGCVVVGLRVLSVFVANNKIAPNDESGHPDQKLEDQPEIWRTGVMLTLSSRLRRRVFFTGLLRTKKKRGSSAFHCHNKITTTKNKIRKQNKNKPFLGEFFPPLMRLGKNVLPPKKNVSCPIATMSATADRRERTHSHTSLSLHLLIKERCYSPPAPSLSLSRQESWLLSFQLCARE
jgi:hypothetical protein